MATFRAVALACSIPILTLALGVSAPASAAPIARNVTLTLSVKLAGVPEVTSVSSATTVTVDEALGTIAFGAGILTGSAPAVPVTSTSSIHSLVLTGISNAAATLSIGGATLFETPCPGGAPATGVACAAGGGLGGLLNFAGFLRVVIVPGIASYAFPQATGVFTSVDFAAFTRYTAWAGTATLPGTVTQTGSTAPNTLNLVAPVAVLTAMERTLTLEFTDGGGLPGFVNATVPEPSSVALLLAGASGLGWLWRTRPRA